MNSTISLGDLVTFNLDRPGIVVGISAPFGLYRNGVLDREVTLVRVYDRKSDELLTVDLADVV